MSEYRPGMAQEKSGHPKYKIIYNEHEFMGARSTKWRKSDEIEYEV